MLRSLALRAAAQRGKKAGLQIDTPTGSLRRALSEELLSDVGVVDSAAVGGGGRNSSAADNVYKGLKVSDQPSSVRTRHRRNSAGDESEVVVVVDGRGQQLTAAAATGQSSHRPSLKVADYFILFPSLFLYK